MEQRQDCWNRRGVWGEATCPQLPQVVHCHNCPVYIAAGRQFLERIASAGEGYAWPDSLEQEPAEGEAEDAISLLIVRLGTAYVALPTQVCKEVAEMRAIHTLPHRRGRLPLGLVSIRGELQLCAGLSQFLGLEGSKEPAALARSPAAQQLLLVEREGDSWVFVVDKIAGLYHFPATAVRSVPVTVTNATPRFVTGLIAWAEQEVGCLDPELLWTALHREML
jgi:chemotaxis-related protein WspD